MAPPDPQELSAAIVGTLIVLAVFGCAWIWATMAVRWLRRRPVLPYQPRRPVPWRTIDVVLLVMVYIIGPSLVFRASLAWFGVPMPPKAEAGKAAQLDQSHLLSRVLLESPDAWTIVLGVESAIIVAPLTEELVFRLLLQGWLEMLERRLRRRVAWLRRVVAGLLPIVPVALLFAAMHSRTPGPRMDLPLVVLAVSASSAAGLLTVAVSILWLRFAAGATLTDFGVVPGKLAADLRIGALALLAVTVPVLAIRMDVGELLPKNVVSDPIPIFFLAVALGILYYRTHRIVSSIVLHMAFNAVGVLMALAVLK
jgi:membrane protease YdiL (CAAX protease family)